jgi:hypothetical protein
LRDLIHIRTPAGAAEEKKIDGAGRLNGGFVYVAEKE